MTSNLISFDDFLEKVRIENSTILLSGEDFTFDVDRNLLTLNLTDPLLYNHDYKIEINGLKDVDGNQIKVKEPILFYSKLLPFHSSVIKVREVLQDLSMFFSSREISISIRDASQKAYQYLKMNPDPNLKGFTVLSESESVYFSIRKYVAYFSAHLLINRLLGKIISNDLPPVYTEDEEGEEIVSDLFGDGFEFKLGDFQVKPDSGSENEKDPKKKADALAAIFDKIKELEPHIKREWKFWLDESMNRNRRGYADMTSAEIKTGSFRPEDRDF